MEQIRPGAIRSGPQSVWSGRSGAGRLWSAGLADVWGAAGLEQPVRSGAGPWAGLERGRSPERVRPGSGARRAWRSGVSQFFFEAIRVVIDVLHDSKYLAAVDEARSQLPKIECVCAAVRATSSVSCRKANKLFKTA